MYSQNVNGEIGFGEGFCYIFEYWGVVIGFGIVVVCDKQNVWFFDL